MIRTSAGAGAAQQQQQQRRLWRLLASKTRRTAAIVSPRGAISSVHPQTRLAPRPPASRRFSPTQSRTGTRTGYNTPGVDRSIDRSRKQAGGFTAPSGNSRGACFDCQIQLARRMQRSGGGGRPVVLPVRFHPNNNSSTQSSRNNRRGRIVLSYLIAVSSRSNVLLRPSPPPNPLSKCLRAK